MGDCLTEGTVLSTYEEFPAIDAANRYFTPKGIVAPNDIRPLTAEVDPRGSLSKAAGSAYVHTEDNKVYYYEKTGKGPRDSTYVTTKTAATIIADELSSFRAIAPQFIQVGDIVEVQVSFVGIPLRDNKWKISTVLRSISLFDGQFTQVRLTMHWLGYAITNRNTI